MPIEVEGPDGRMHSFPVGTDRNAINQHLDQMYGGAAGQPGVGQGLLTPNDPQPRAGAPTALGGAMAPGSRVVAPYQNEEDWNNIGMSMLFGEKNRGLITAIQNTPGHQARVEYEKKMADTNANRASQQIASKSLLDQIDKLQLASTRAGSDVLSKAIGPNYATRTTDSAAANTLNAIGNLGVGAMSGNRAVAFGMDTGDNGYVAQQAARYGSGDPDKPNAYDKAVGLNAEMHHFKKGIATLFKTIPGGGRSGGTDQAQATLEEMVQAAINAPDKETHFKILNDASNFVRAFGGQPQIPDREKYTPDGFGPEKSNFEAKLKAGSTYMHNGQSWVYKGGSAADPNSWAAAR